MSDEIKWPNYGSLRECQPGDTIFREGDPGDSLYVVKSGRVAILKEDKDGGEALALGYREAGRLLGEVSLLQGTARTATVQAVENTQLYVIPRDVFWLKFNSDLDFRQLVMDNLINHLLVADQGRIDAAATLRGLSEVIRLRQEMTNFIMHDLQNPLGIMLNALEMIPSSPGYNSASETAQMIDLANGAVERMLRLVSALLDTERLKDVDTQLDFAAFNASDMIREIVERAQPIASHKAIRLAIRPMPPDMPPLEADRLWIDRTLTNLIDNGLKFTPMNGRITVSAQAADGWMTIMVNDTGPGIPPENRDQVFLRFVQTEAGQQSQRGFGLGLAFCHAAIVAHDGRIWVEDGDNGIGSKFVFSLPLDAARGRVA